MSVFDPLIQSLIRPLVGLAAFLGLGGAAHAGPLDDLAGWAVFYGAAAAPSQLAKPDLLVLEPDHPWQPAALRRPGQKVLAYLSLGEVHASRPYYAAVAAAPGAIAMKNPHWPDAHMVDPRSAAWRALVLDAVAPAILEKGYDGLFLDTLDVAVFLETEHKRPGARQAMIDLLLALHARFPEALLVANGGQGLLPEAAPAFAAIATESVYTDYQFKPPAYRFRDPAAAEARREALEALHARHGLPILVIEYADPARPEMAKTAAQRVRAAGFVPFVSDIGLTIPGGLP